MDDHNHNKDSIIVPNDLVSTLVRSEISESITDESTNSQKYKSPVWTYFSLLKSEQKAKCNYCNTKLSYKKGNRIFHLRCHLKSCNKYQKSVSNSDSSNLPENELSFQFVEKPDFQNFLNGVLPNFAISADTVKQDIMNVYDKRKAFIKSPSK
ncbi:30760_t:CDS:2, partial [Racocetra persica]